MINPRKNKRYKIGLLLVSLFDDYASGVWSGVVQSAKESDCDLNCYVGGTLESKYNFDYQRNVIYDLINTNDVDGLIIMSGCLSNFTGIEKFRKFLNKFSGLPIVSISSDIDGIPNVLSDNTTGMRDLMIHLIKDHNFRRIAFMTGTGENLESRLRLEAYRNTLEEFGLPVDEKLIFPGDFHIYSGSDTRISDLIDKYQKSFDAIVCSNDLMAIHFIKKLIEMGINVPGDIAVAGFDNIKESRGITPPLTTVSQYPARLGQKAFQAMLSLLNNEKVPHRILIETRFIKRHSCGCYWQENMENIRLEPVQVNVHTALNYEEELNKFTDALENEIDKYLLRLDDAGVAGVYARFIVGSLSGSLNDRDTDAFLKMLENIILGSTDYIDILSWNDIISFVFDGMKIKFSDKYDPQLVELLWKKSLVLIGSLAFRHNPYQYVEYKVQGLEMYTMSEALMSVFNRDELVAFIREKLPRLDIKSAFISLYCMKNGKPDREKSRLIAGYDLDADLKIFNSYTVFNSIDLFPKDINTGGARKTYIISALFFKDIQQGFAVFETGSKLGLLYENLTLQLSSLLRGIDLMEEVRRYSLDLEDKVRERTIKLEMANMEIETANSKLKKLDRLKNDFIANITHDFRSPLTAILNLADLSLKYENTADDNRENFEIIYNAAVKLKTSIDRLLDLARLDAKGLKLKVKRTDINSLLEKIINFYESAAAGTQIRIVKIIPSVSIDGFYTDEEKFEDIISNIMSNAVKFVDGETGVINIELVELPAHMRIIISDNGIGISKDKLEAIFNRFEQAEGGRNSIYKGTGIGLAYSRQLVELLKGSISAESEGPGKGSKFIIDFPKGRNAFNEDDFFDEAGNEGESANDRTRNQLLNAAKSEIQKKLYQDKLLTFINTPNEPGEYDVKKTVILIIDDEEDILKIVMKYLLNDGYKNFVLASDGIRGFEAVYKYNPDIIICDYNMPNMGGDVLHDNLLESPVLKEIPFLFLSAISDRNVINERRRKGACAYLKKPIDEIEFLVTVEQHLKKYLDHKKLAENN